MTINYKNFNEQFIEDFHGRLYFYRKLYLGKHSEIFERAARLVESGEIIDNILNKSPETDFNKTPYIVANITKLVVDVPAMLVARSIGKIDTSLEKKENDDARAGETTDDAIEGTKDQTVNGVIDNLQHELIQQIVKNSKLNSSHWSNLVQQQLDGGLVAVPWNDDRGVRIEFKGRDSYFPHEDEYGADLVHNRKFDDVQYLHVYRERVIIAGVEDESGYRSNVDGLRCTHELKQMGKGGALTDETLPPEQAAKYLKMSVQDLDSFYPGRLTPFIRYWANEATFMNPLGVSVLNGQEGKQDEINWSLTRNAIVFERNGKPRIAINKELANALQKNMVELYGEKGRGKFDHRKLEVFTMDDNGNSMQIFQIDVSKIGDIAHVKDLIKLMLMETRTSEKAIDFYMDSGGGGAQSGIAKFYDLFLSLMKAEQLQMEYIQFLKELVKDALWLSNLDDPAVQIEEPEIGIKEMIPIQRKEVVDEYMAMFPGKQAISLETLLRKLFPHASEDWILDEVARIEAEQVSMDSTALGVTGAQTLSNFLDNPNQRPTPGTPVPPADTE